MSYIKATLIREREDTGALVNLTSLSSQKIKETILLSYIKLVKQKTLIQTTYEWLKIKTI